MNNKFSLDRLGMLWHFYSPAIRLQWTIGGCAVVLAYFLMLFGVSQLGILGHDEGPWAMGGFMAFWLGGVLGEWTIFSAPFIFAMCRQRRCATVLPALWQEKAVFTLGYTLVLYPLFLALIWCVCTAIGSIFTDYGMVYDAFVRDIFDVRLEFNQQMREIFAMSKLYAPIYALMVISTSLYAIAFSRRSRLAKGIVGVLGAMALNFIIGLCAGIFILVRAFSDNLVNMNPNTPEFVNGVIGSFMTAYQIWTVALAVISAALLVAVVLKIKNRQD